MTRSFSLRHDLNVSVEGFWRHIFESERFNRALYEERLGFDYKLEHWDASSGLRRARIWPTADVPKPVAAVLGDKLSLLEEGTYDRESGRYEFRAVPSTLSDRVVTRGSVVAEAVDDDRCVRTVEITIEARVFGVGKLIEAFVESTTRDQYNINAEYANEYLAEHGLS